MAWLALSGELFGTIVWAPRTGAKETEMKQSKGMKWPLTLHRVDVRLLKVMGVVGLSMDFLFHWVEEKSLIGIVTDGFASEHLSLTGIWLWGVRSLGFLAHILFIIAFMALIFLPIKIRDIKSPWDGLRQVAWIKDSPAYIFVTSLLILSALAIAIKALALWPFDEMWVYSR